LIKEGEKMNGRHQQGSQDNPLERLKQELRSREITQFSERELFHPEGYASKVMGMKENKITSVQLRKIFHEFKAIVDGLKKGDNLDKAMGRLYKLYALLEYQAKREVLKENFKELMFELFGNIEREIEKIRKEKDGKERDKVIEVFDKAHDFLMAMVAYSKKS
jgi:CRISPR type III-A-associated protein Csm2